jgi:hypothetical protein
MQECWTSHYHYDEIASLTDVQFAMRESGISNDDKAMKIIDDKINAMFDEMYLEGVNCEGYEPKWELVQEALTKVDSEGKFIGNENILGDYGYFCIDGIVYEEWDSDLEHPVDVEEQFGGSD